MKIIIVCSLKRDYFLTDNISHTIEIIIFTLGMMVAINAQARFDDLDPYSGSAKANKSALHALGN